MNAPETHCGNVARTPDEGTTSGTTSADQQQNASHDQCNAGRETAYLLASPANATHLRKSIQEANDGANASFERWLAMSKDISEQSSVIASDLRSEDAEFALVQPDTTPRPKPPRKKPLSKSAARDKAQHAKTSAPSKRPAVKRQAAKPKKANRKKAERTKPGTARATAIANARQRNRNRVGRSA